MPVPAPVLYPPFNTVRLSHVELGVTNLAASRRFYVDTLGLQVTHEDAQTIYLRAMEERGHHCIILRQGRSRRSAFWASRSRPKATSTPPTPSSPPQGLPVDWVNRPFMGRTLRTHDPHGIPLEFYATMDRLPPIHQKYALYQRRQTAADRPFQLLFPRCRCLGRVLERHRLPRDRIYRRCRDRPPLGRLDAPQGRRA